MQKLTEQSVEERLAALPNWSELNGAIQRTYQLPDFPAAMAFVNKIAELAESRAHHPDILIRWNKVTLTLSTHDANGITDKDFDFAQQADQL